jgi:hypothetical protein
MRLSPNTSMETRRRRGEAARIIRVGVPALLAVLAPLLSTSALASSSGPLNGYTGAPGEPNCTACHTSFPVNSGAGSLAVTGLPGSYAPGETYDLQVHLIDPDASRWGFEFTILDAAGQSAGTLANVSTATQVSTDALSGKVYAKHTLSGTRNGQVNEADWTVRWTAPAAGSGDLTLYVAGNAANGGTFALGDRIYTNSFAAMEGAASPVPGATLAASLSGFPNPFNPAITIRLRLDAGADVRVTVHDVTGRRVGTLHEGRIEAGEMDLRWQGRTDSGQPVPSGLYFAHVADAGGRPLARPLKMVLAK